MISLAKAELLGTDHTGSSSLKVRVVHVGSEWDSNRKELSGAFTETETCALVPVGLSPSSTNSGRNPLLPWGWVCQQEHPGHPEDALREGGTEGAVTPGARGGKGHYSGGSLVSTSLPS